ncbi:hypothetical protein AG1IA_09484 [Rhizoctonia solani AG-1 IA]|uniref:Uncharacterized protein n=1 Tax=Thanatephorus cucumeris (strain AG1-IA) TaxID=983506 RepID=L8WJE1_THACA|nr:hypothetical protein AG1IA_09484 [Rhizoctonia solani AG-1 IA]
MAHPQQLHDSFALNDVIAPIVTPEKGQVAKSLGSWGSMVARLKLKRIDRREPPGVEPAA